MPPEERPPPSVRVTSRSERRALGAVALASMFALALISYPVASGLFLGTVLAFTLLPAYRRLSRRPERRGLVALGLTLASGVVIVGTLSVLAYFVIDRGIRAAN